ncbi:MAG: hypothetical protein ABSE80_11500 [Halobacteriota archaeon]|jgi:hypothetical protein
MPRILLAIFSCHEYKYEIAGCRDWFSRPITNRIQGIRDSWLKDVTCDYRIFKGFGKGRTPPQDEVDLPCLDDYFHSADKLRAMLKYALDRGYDRIFKCDDDVFVYYDRLMANVPTADYVGSGRGWSVESSKQFRTDFCPGFTYWLSKRSMETLLQCPAGCWAEDRWVGESLKRKGIHLTTDHRYHLVKPTKTNQYISDGELGKSNNYLTIHSLSPDQMRRLYARRSA